MYLNVYNINFYFLARLETIFNKNKNTTNISIYGNSNKNHDSFVHPYLQNKFNIHDHKRIKNTFNK